MSETTAVPRTRSTVKSVLIAILLISLVAGAANAIIAVAVLIAGAEPALPGLMPGAYIFMTIVGASIAAIGWAIIRRSTTHAAGLLKVLVPVLLALSLVPPVGLVLAGPNTASTLAGAGLALMHVVTVAVAVPVLRHFVPLSPAAANLASARQR